MRLYLASIGSLPYLCTKNESMAPLHVSTLTVQRELIILDLYPPSGVAISYYTYLYTMQMNGEILYWLNQATLYTKRENEYMMITSIQYRGGREMRGATILGKSKKSRGATQ